MIQIVAEKNNLRVAKNEMLTSGSLNVYYVSFELSEEWEGLRRIVCWRIQGNVPEYAEYVVRAQDAELEDELICVMPFAMTRFAGTEVQIGIYGIDPDTNQVVLPTIWASLGVVRQGVIPSGNIELPNIEGAVTVDQINQQIAKYLKDYPIQWDTIQNKPTPIPISELEEMLK